MFVVGDVVRLVGSSDFDDYSYSITLYATPHIGRKETGTVFVNEHCLVVDVNTEELGNVTKQCYTDIKILTSRGAVGWRSDIRFERV